MRVASEAFRIISRPDTEPAEGFPHSAEERRALNSDEASGLVDLLSDIDGLKHEINERIRRMDAVKQARALLMEDAARTEMLNKRLAGLGMAPVPAPAVSPASDRELHYPHHHSAGSAGSSTVPWPRSDEPENHSAQVHQREEHSREHHQEPRFSAAESAALEQAIQRLEQAELKIQRLEQEEQKWKEYEQAAFEAKRLVAESAAHMSNAASKEQQATADLLAAQEALAATQQSASERIDEAERCWKLVDGAAQMVKERVEQASKELAESVARQEAASADLLTARQDLTTAYQFASVAAQRRLESREFFVKASRWMIIATAISWAIMGWLAWLSFRQFVPIWAPGVLTVVILVAASLIKTKEKEEA